VDYFAANNFICYFKLFIVIDIIIIVTIDLLVY